jgi:hypothetical protein
LADELKGSVYELMVVTHLPASHVITFLADRIGFVVINIDDITNSGSRPSRYPLAALRPSFA